MTDQDIQKYERIFKENFDKKMKGAKIGVISIDRFKKEYKTLYAVIIDSMHESSNKN